MRRSIVLALVLVAVLVLGLSWLVLSPWGQGWLRGPGTLSLEEIEPLPDVPLPEGRRIAYGSLGLKYLTAEELEDLGFLRDSHREQVPYRADLALERWVFVLRMDAIPALTEPEFTGMEEGNRWLSDDDLVLGIVYEGLVRAYPVRILDRHEVVNDHFGKVPVLITYCPLCFSGAAFVRPSVAGRVLEFGVSGRLYNANLLMYDRQSGSLWSQFTGEPIAGPLVGKISPLARIPLDVVSWGEWKAAHPETQVLARPTRVKTPKRTLSFSPEHYERYAYDEYRLKPQVGFGVDIRDLPLRGVNAKRKVVGLVVGGRAMAYEEHVLKREGLVNDVIGGEPIVIFHAPDDRIRAFRRTVGGRTLTFRRVSEVLIDQETGTHWSFDGVPQEGPLANAGALEELVVHSAFWFAWVAFYPDSGLYSERN